MWSNLDKPSITPFSSPTLLLFTTTPVRRAHLKECFETLKKNIPNVDEKKASNLSVLRSALRYIQVRLRNFHYARPEVLSRCRLLPGSSALNSLDANHTFISDPNVHDA